MSVAERPVVLIVEDNPQILMLVEHVAEEAGCLALPARSSDEAVAILKTRGDVLAVLTDIQIPGKMNGVGLAFLVHETWPAIGLIVSSGWSSLEAGDLPPGSKFFPKPYDLTELQAELKRWADRSPPS